MEPLFEIIYEDAELLAINKLADLVCHPSKNGPMSSLIGRVRLYLGAESHPHLANRLDRETSGVTLVAKTDAAARELRRLWESREVEKEYLAIVHGHVSEDHQIIDAPLGKDETSRVAIKDCVRADGLPSQTEFFVVRRFQLSDDYSPSPASRRSEAKADGGEGRGEGELNKQIAGNEPSVFSLLRIRLLTGRKHQIRIHLAHIGHPIVGDKIYGGDEDLYLSLVEGRLDDEQKRTLILPHQALHARVVRFNWRGQKMEFCCEPERWFREFCKAESAVGA